MVAAVGMMGGCAQPETEAVTETRIVFFGDSITEAGDNPGGYVDIIRTALAGEEGEPAVQVIGAGISGHKVPDLQARLDRDVLAHHPTHVVIYIGINDVWHAFEFDHVTGTDPETFEAGLTDLVQTIGSHGADVYLCTPSVIGEDPTSDAPVNQRLMEYADISRAVADATGATLCDLRRAFEEHLAEHNAEGVYEGILTTDGVHLNEAGNRFVADYLLSVLELPSE